MEEFEQEEFTYDKIGEIYGISIEEERLLWESQYINKYIYICLQYVPNVTKVILYYI